MDTPNAHLVEWPDATAVKVVQSPHLPYVTTYQVTVEFITEQDANEFVRAICEYSKSSGIDGDAGDWTQHGDGTGYPDMPRLVSTGNVPVDNEVLKTDEVADEPIHE